MVARGHGIETLCLYLRLAQSALFDLVVMLGLPTPPDKVFRKSVARNRWQPNDISDFIVLWMDGWAAASLADRFGRSRSAVWSKARQLGLPRRERRDQFRPANPQLSFDLLVVKDGLDSLPVQHRMLPAALKSHDPLMALGRPQSIQAVPTLIIDGVTQSQLAAAINLAPIERKGERGGIAYTPALDLQIALRHFGSQHYRAAARELGMSIYAYLTRRKRLGLRPMPRNEFVEEFNPTWAAEYIKAAGFRRLQCKAFKSRGVEFYFWCGTDERLRFSGTAKKTNWHREAASQLELGYGL